MRLRGFIESDRGIYRPGETVARELPLDGPARVPAQRSVEVHVADGKGGTVHDQRLTLSEFGGFHFDGARSARPPATTTSPPSSASRPSWQIFSVEEVRPVSFEITTQGTPEHVRLGQKTKLAFEARYLFGAPVSEANVHYEVQRRPRWLDFEAFPSTRSTTTRTCPTGTVVAGRQLLGLRLRRRGPDRREGPLLVRRAGHQQGSEGRAGLHGAASVRDATDQEVTKSFVIHADPSDFYLGLHTEQWVATVGKPLRLDMVAVDPKGTQVGTAATLTLARERWECKPTDGPYW